MKHLLFSLSTLVLTSLALAEAVPIFDGKTLAGWEGDAKIWRVEGGMITGGSLTETVARNEFLATKKSYANFDLRLKIKITGTGFVNSGVQIRSVRVPGSSEMAGYQVDAGIGWWGKLYDESRRNKVVGEPKDAAALAAVVKPVDWNEYRIRAEGPRIQTWINGVPALDYTEADAKIAQDGFIGIQVHGGGKALAQVKDVTIEELPVTADAPTWDKVGRPGEKKSAVSSQQSAVGARTAAEERALLKVPEGYEVELVAEEDPANGIGKFVCLAFDQKGRLWTTTALEYPVDGNENPAAADALYASKAKDKVLVFDTPFAPGPQKARVFAEGLAIPLGVLPYKDGCYVQHGHDIALLRDTDGDGKADKRDVILTGFGVQDSHLFPHQFTRAPGGWIWMAQGAFNYSKVRRPDEPPEKAVQFDQTRMAKFRPDGSGFDITSNGPCNIWGLVINGEGEAFIQEANDFGYPVMPFHEYANYPGCSNAQWKSYAPEFPGTPGIPMGGTGLSGLALSDKTGPFTEAWRDVMFVANPITNRINAIKMHRDGPRWRLEKLPDFLVSEDPWFRPVAIATGPDGCLYIVDWYNKIISHNEVARAHPDRDKTRGRIWRVKAKGVAPFVMTDFTKATGDELLAKLGGPSLAQSHLAWQAIGDRGMKELAPRLREIVSGVGWASRLPGDASRVTPADVKPGSIVEQRPDVPRETRPTAGGTPTLPDGTRIAALWALAGLGENSVELTTELLTAQNRNVRREALRIAEPATTWPWGESTKPFESVASDTDPEVRAELLRWVARSPALDGPDGRIGIALLLSLARAPLAEPLTPSTQNGKPIKIREAYDREFERYLVRMFLERHPDAVAKFLDSDGAKELPIEARLLASLALEPKASAARVAKLLPQLQRAPGQEEVLRLAQFPDEPGVGEALKATLQNPVTRTAALEALLAVRTKLDATKLTPFLADAATTLLASKDPASLDLGLKLSAGFKLANAEPALIALLSRGTGFQPVGPAGILPVDPTAGGTPAGPTARMAVPLLRALAELGSKESALFAKLAESSLDAAVRDEALAALAASKATDAPQRVLSLYPKLSPAQRRTALDRLATNKPGASAVVAAITAGTLPKTDLDAPTLDRLQTVLGANEPALAKLMESLGALFRPVLMLDGKDNAFAETGLTLEGPLTVETWVRLEPGIGNQDGILGAPGQFDLNFFDSRFRVFAGPAIHDAIVAKKPITPGLWTHVAATRDASGKWKLYIDGELDTAESKPAGHKIEKAMLGWSGTAGGTHGALAEFRIWNRERTADEIRGFFDRSFAGQKPDGLVFQGSGDQGWGKLHSGAKLAKTSDFPPVATAEEAKALDAKFTQYRALAEQPGDVARGKTAAAALCQACHLMGPVGGSIGPNLSGVGAMGVEAILRNLLTPNAAMENAYRIYRVELKSGDLVEAFFVSEDKDAVVVRMPGAQDRRIAKADIRATTWLRRSLMPESLLDTMQPGQVSDLFAYLKTLK